MVLKDFECRDCGSVTEQMVEGRIEVWRFVCKRCGKKRNHNSIISGGHINQREMTSHETLHHIDKHISFEGVRVGIPNAPGSKNESSNITPTKDLHGRVIQDLPRFAKEAAQEKQQRRMFERQKKADRQKVSVTARSS
jgi:hypothetical protein